MAQQFTGTFVLDDSQAQSTIQKTNTQLKNQEAQITNNKHRLDTYFQWAMHMANIWGTYMARTAEGQAALQKYQTIVQGLNILSAELSIALTVKRAMSDFGQGNFVAGAFQLAIAGSMQAILLDMERLKREQEAMSNAINDSVTYFNNYR